MGGGRFVEQFWPNNKHNSDRKIFYANHYWLCVGVGGERGGGGWMRGAPLPYIS